MNIGSTPAMRAAFAKNPLTLGRRMVQPLTQLFLVTPYCREFPSCPGFNPICKAPP